MTSPTLTGRPLTVLLRNVEGDEILAGSVVGLAPTADAAVWLVATAADYRAIGVTTETIPDGERGRIQIAGTVYCRIQGAVGRGDYLETGTLAGKLRSTGVVNGATTPPPAGSCAIALEAGADDELILVEFTGPSTAGAAGGGGITVEDAQDAVGNILVDSTEIDFTYDDAAPSISAVLRDNSIAPPRLTLATGTLVGRSSAGTGAGEAISIGAGLALVGGVLSATGGASYTDEQAQDAVGNILVDSTEIDFTYADATPSITASLRTNSVGVSRLTMPTGVLVGRSSAGAGIGEVINVGAGLIIGAGFLVLDTSSPITWSAIHTFQVQTRFVRTWSPIVEDSLVYVEATLNVDNASGSNAGIRQISYVRPTLANTSGNGFDGIESFVEHDQGAFSLIWMHGTHNTAKQNVAGSTVTNALGSANEVWAAAGTIADGKALEGRLTVNTGATMTAGYGLDVIRTVAAGGSLPTAVGIRIQAVSGSVANDIAIQSLGGQNRFVGITTIGSNAAATAGYGLDVRTKTFFGGSFTSTATLDAWVYSAPTVANSHIAVNALHVGPTFGGAGDEPAAAYFRPFFNPSSPITLAMGGSLSAIHGSGQIGDLVGFRPVVASFASTGSVQNFKGVRVDAPAYTATVRPTNTYGIEIRDQGTTGVATTVGLLIQNQTGSTTLIAIQSLGGQNRFVGNTIMGADAVPGSVLDIRGATVGLWVRPTLTNGDFGNIAVIGGTHTTTANISEAHGLLLNTAFNPGAGTTIAAAISTYYFATTGSGGGAISNLYNAFILPNYGSVKPTTVYALAIANHGSSGIGNAVGLMVNAQTGAINNYDMGFSRVDLTLAGTYYGRVPVLYNGLMKYLHVFNA
jgi:hypothetical protein